MTMTADSPDRADQRVERAIDQYRDAVVERVRAFMRSDHNYDERLKDQAAARQALLDLYAGERIVVGGEDQRPPFPEVHVEGCSLDKDHIGPCRHLPDDGTRPKPPADFGDVGVNDEGLEGVGRSSEPSDMTELPRSIVPPSPSDLVAELERLGRRPLLCECSECRLVSELAAGFTPAPSEEGEK